MRGPVGGKKRGPAKGESADLGGQNPESVRKVKGGTPTTRSEGKGGNHGRQELAILEGSCPERVAPRNAENTGEEGAKKRTDKKKLILTKPKVSGSEKKSRKKPASKNRNKTHLKQGGQGKLVLGHKARRGVNERVTGRPGDKRVGRKIVGVWTGAEGLGGFSQRKKEERDWKPRVQRGEEHHWEKERLRSTARAVEANVRWRGTKQSCVNNGVPTGGRQPRWLKKKKKSRAGKDPWKSGGPDSQTRRGKSKKKKTTACMAGKKSRGNDGARSENSGRGTRGTCYGSRCRVWIDQAH